MGWEEAWAALESSWEEEDRAEFRAEVGDRARHEIAQLALLDRLRAACGLPVTLSVLGAGAVPGVLRDVGPDWLLLVDERARAVLVPRAALLAVAGLGRQSGAPGEGGWVAARLRLGHALRGLARSRVAVTVVLIDGSSATGTIDRVGSDFVELAEHAPGEPRRVAAVRSVRALPLPAIALVRATATR